VPALATVFLRSVRLQADLDGGERIAPIPIRGRRDPVELVRLA